MSDLLMFFGGAIFAAALFGWWIRYTEFRDAREAKQEMDRLDSLWKQLKTKPKENDHV